MFMLLDRQRYDDDDDDDTQTDKARRIGLYDSLGEDINNYDDNDDDPNNKW